MPAKRSVDEVIAAHRRPLRMTELKPEELKGVDRMLKEGVSVPAALEWLRLDCGYGDRITVHVIRTYAAKRRSSHR